MIDTSLVVMVWATALVVLLIRTNSIRTDIPTSLMSIGLLVMSILHRIYGEIGCLFIMMAIMSVLVYRVIPDDSKDTWSKNA